MLSIFTSKPPYQHPRPYSDESNRFLESQVKRSMIKTFNNVDIVSCTMYNITIRDHVQALYNTNTCMPRVWTYDDLLLVQYKYNVVQYYKHEMWFRFWE